MDAVLRALVVVLIALLPASAAGQGLNHILDGASSPSEPAPAPSAPKTPDPAAKPAGRIDARIKVLKTRLASLPAESFADLASARDRVAQLRQLVDYTGKNLYIPDPGAGSAAAQRLAAFQQRWADLAGAILNGLPPAQPLAAERWTVYARGFNRIDCGDARVSLTAPPGGMPMRGWAWTCLSDLFFHEFAAIEAGVERTLTARRRVATDDLERAMQRAEFTLALAANDDANQPRLLRTLEGQLADVNARGLRLSIRALELQRDNGPGVDAFRWLVDHSPVVHRPEAGVRLKVSVGGASAEARLAAPEPPRTARLATDLHHAHYRLARLQSEGRPDATRSQAATEARRQALVSMAAEAR